MPRRTPQIINGRTPEQYTRELHREYNELVRSHGWLLRPEPRQWNTNVIPNVWSSVRWAAQRLHVVRTRLEHNRRGGTLLERSELLDGLPTEWYINGIQAPTGRTRRTRQQAIRQTFDWEAFDATVRSQPIPGMSFQPTAVQTEVSQAAIEAVAFEAGLEAFTFGVEIECYLRNDSTHAEMARILQEAGVNATTEMYNHHRRDWWKLVTDGSLNDYRTGCELVSPVLRGAAGIAEMRKVCQVVEQAGARIRRSCGFHVHIGMANQPVTTWRNLLRLYGHFEGAVDSFTSRSRRGTGNQYCKSTRNALRMNEVAVNSAQTVESLARAYAPNGSYTNSHGIDRFFKVNMASFWRHGTVEFRQHQGTVDADKAENWVKFCLRMVAAAQAGVTPDGEDTLPNLADKIKIAEKELAFFQSRVAVLERVGVERR
jgi:hypothetical protein